MAITKVSPLAFREVSENYVPVLIKGERKKNHVISPILIKFLKRHPVRELPGCPVVRTLCFYCRQLGFDPWSENQDPARQCMHACSVTSIMSDFL